MKENKYTLKVILWENGILKTIVKFFNSLIETIKESKLYKGIIKIYDNLNQLLHTNNYGDNIYC
jgi:hypothetical protein